MQQPFNLPLSPGSRLACGNIKLVNGVLFSPKSLVSLSSTLIILHVLKKKESKLCIYHYQAEITKCESKDYPKLLRKIHKPPIDLEIKEELKLKIANI